MESSSEEDQEIVYHPPPKYICEYCTHVAENDEALELHSKKHMEPIYNKNTCEECGDQFLLPGFLKRHTRLFHKPKDAKLTCDQCGKPFRKPDERNFKRAHLTLGILMCKQCSVKKDN